MSSNLRPSKRRRLSAEDSNPRASQQRDDSNGSVIGHVTKDRPATKLSTKDGHKQPSDNHASATGQPRPRAESRRQPISVTGHSKSATTSRFEPLSAISQVQGSNILKLQLDELLEKESFRSKSLQTSVDHLLHKLKTLIEAIPDSDPSPILDAEEHLIKSNRVAIPFSEPRPTRGANYKLQFQKPCLINVVGAYPLKLLSKPKHELRVDMLVMMPASLFQDKDFLDHRYFYRRAYYAAKIAAALKASGASFDVSYEYLNGNYLQPIVAITSDPNANGTSKKIVVQLIPGVPEGVFPSERTLPTKCLLRQPLEDHNRKTKNLPIPTTFYNGSLRSDTLYLSYMKLLYNASKLCDNFQDACALGRTWLRQRGLATNVFAGGFGNFEWACLMALLLGTDRGDKGVLSSGYSSYQLFKAAIGFLASNDLAHTGYSTTPFAIALPLAENWPCFYDADRSHNILYKMTQWSYQTLRHEAEITTQALANNVFDPFAATFLATTTEAASRFDITIELPLSHLLSRSETPPVYPAILQNLYEVVRKAMTDRARLIHLQLPVLTSWSLINAPSSLKPAHNVVMGILVNSAEVSRAMDRGPSMENKKEVKGYLDFWGHDKAVRMKFGSDSPIETVKWDTAGNASSIPEQIIRHVLGRHFSKELAGATTIIADRFVPTALHGTQPLSNSSKAASSALNAFRQFERQLRSLEGLPLQIRHVLPAHTATQYKQIKAKRVEMSTPIADVVVQFEGSGRWPGDLAAIQRTKVALLLKMKDVYDASDDGLSSQLGLENQRDHTMNQSYLNVTHPELKSTFRIRIYYEREVYLLEQRVKNEAASRTARRSAERALAKCKQDFVCRPAHTQALQRLCTRFASLSTAIQMVKAWLAAHLLLGDRHISEELVDLMVVKAYTQSWPWDTPGSASLAFLRTIRWLAAWNWKTEPLIVDLTLRDTSDALFETESSHASLRSGDISSIETKFNAWRHIDPLLNRIVLFAASSINKDGTIWTDHCRPAKVVASRMTKLAQAAYELVQAEGFKLQPDLLFTVDLQDFDFVLQLDLSAVYAGLRHPHTSSYRNLEVQSTSNGLGGSGDLDPVKLFIDELCDTYDDAVIFFHDQRRGRSIAGIWNPTMDGRPWKVKLPASMMLMSPSEADRRQPKPRSQQDLVRLNKAAILHEISRLGGSMIEKVVVNRSL